MIKIWVVTKEEGPGQESKDVTFVKAYRNHADAEHHRYLLEKDAPVYTIYYVNEVDMED